MGRLVNLLPFVFGLEHDSEVSVIAGKRCQELWQEDHLGLRLPPSCCVF